MANIVLPSVYLNIDGNGVCEDYPVSYDFSAHPIIVGGDSLANTPPTFTQKGPGQGYQQLSFGIFPTLSGNIWSLPVSISGGAPGTKYQTVCTAKTVGGNTIEVSLVFELSGIGISAPEPLSTAYTNFPNIFTAPQTFNTSIVIDNLSGVLQATAGTVSGNAPVVLPNVANVFTQPQTMPGLTLGTMSGVLQATAGVVSGSATTSSLPEGSNIYFTNARASAAAPVQSVFGRTGAVVLQASDLSALDAALTNDANTFTAAPQTIQIDGPTHSGLIVKSAALQTANPLVFTTNTGTPYVTIGPPTLTGAANSNFINITGTIVGTNNNSGAGVFIGLTTENVTAGPRYGTMIVLLPGYTGSSHTTVFEAINSVAGTGTNLNLSLTGTEPGGNSGICGFSISSTTGINTGIFGEAGSGSTNIGVFGKALIPMNSGINIAVAGFGLNTGTSPTQIAGYFGLQNATPTFASAALIADNGSTSSPVILARVNGVSTFQVDALGKAGYGVGAGGTVTQLTSKSTGVTLNKATGQITLVNTAIAPNSVATFVFTNSTIAATDEVRVWVVSGEATAGSYLVNTTEIASGTCNVNVRNLTAGSLSEALVLGFNVFKGATS